MIAIYARQSVEKEDSISIESQIEMCTYEARGEAFLVYKDKGFSGKNTNRPEFQRMMQDIRTGRKGITKVIVYKLDRISRSILDFSNMMDIFGKLGVEFSSATEKFDTSTPMGRAMLNICITFAQLERETTQQRVIKILVMAALYAFLLVMALIVLFPFYWMIASSLKSLAEYRLSVPTFIPKSWMFSNYIDAFTTAKLGRLFLNTMYVGVVSTILSLIITVLSAFAFARLEFKGKNTMFAALLATMMIPGELFTITNYATVTQFGWTNTFIVLIVPFLVSVFYIYLLRQNFLQIPNELYLAAKVDGTSDFKYLWKVMVPLALPTLISITILKMMGAWNSYIWPRLVANDEAHRMITNGLRNAFTATTGDVNYPVQMAAVALVSAPLFLVFVFLRKCIMSGVSGSGIKG